MLFASVVSRLPQRLNSTIYMFILYPAGPVRKFKKNTLSSAFEANSAASLICTYFRILVHIAWRVLLELEKNSTLTYLKWQRKVLRSLRIWTELSSGCATLKILNLQFFQVRCCLRRNGSNISRPPSWTIHQISMFPKIWGKEILYIKF